MSQYRLALLAAALALAQSASAVTLTGSASSGAAGVGGPGSVDLSLELSDPVDLLGATLKLDWAPGLSFEAASTTIFGMSLANFIAQFDPAFTVETPSVPGQYSLSVLADLVAPSLLAGATGMSFGFTGLNPGVQSVKVDLSLTVMDENAMFTDLPLAFDSSVTVIAAIPEPSPALLLAAGLGVLGLLARRRHS